MGILNGKFIENNKLLGIGYEVNYLGQLELKSIPITKITNILLVGSQGYGKTESLKLIVKNCAKKGFGFVLVDPHGGLARDTVAILKTYGVSDFVYVAPHMAMETEKIVKINPLDLDIELVNVFIDQLKHVSHGWGDRLEPILRNSFAALIMLGEEYKTIENLRRFVIDAAYRESLIPKLQDRTLRSYFKDVFPNYSKDAGPAAFNKLDRLLSNPLVRSLFDVTTIPEEDKYKILSFGKMIKENKKVIIDLAGIDESSAGFIGGVVLMMVFSSVSRMLERIENPDNPFFVLLDEAQHFAPVLRELLNKFRKFNIKIVFATQTLAEKKIPFASEIIELTSTICSFRVGRDTLKPIKDIMLSEESMVKLEPYTFYCYSRGNPPAKGVLKTKQLVMEVGYDPQTVEGRANIKNLISENIDKYGVSISKEAFVVINRGIEVKLPFLDYAIITELFKHGNSMDREKLYELMDEKYGFKKEKTRIALQRLYTSQFMELHDDIVIINQYSISSIFHTIPKGQRGGSDKHIDVISRIALYHRQNTDWVDVDVGDTNRPKADVTVVSYVRYSEESDYEWDYDNIIVYEVETNPSAHPEQVFKNFSKNYSKGFAVNFVVFSETDRKNIFDILTEKGIQTTQYKVWLVSELPKPQPHARQQTEEVALPAIAPPNTCAIENTINEYKNISANNINSVEELIEKVRKNYKDTESISQLQKEGYTITIDERDSYTKIRIRNTSTGDDHKYTVKKTIID